MTIRAGKCSPKEGGFSLVEVMIALLLATFGLLAAAQLLFTAASSASLARSKIAAVYAARETLESLSDLYARNPSHQDLAPGIHGPKEIAIKNPRDGTVLNLFQVTWSTARIQDPRLDKSPDAIFVKVTAAPVLPDGTPNYRPLLNRVLNISTILSPRMP